MIRKHLAVALLLLFPLALKEAAQDKPDDPGGWTKAKWGMSQDEIQKAFPEARQIAERGTVQKLELRRIKIGSLSYTVHFVFGTGSEGLNKVFLFPEGERAIYAEAAQRSLLTMLSDKYGPPGQSAERDLYDPNGKSREWKWILPETEITLGFLDYRESANNYTVLTYHKREKSDVL